MDFEELDFKPLDMDDFGEAKPIAVREKQKTCSQCLAGTVAAKVMKRNSKHVYRRAYSEVTLLDILERDFTPDASYHIISGGDIDSLSYLKHILRQQSLEYLLFSTWCMALDDVQQFREWAEQGKITRLDAYVGEIFPGSYSREHEELKKVVELTGGRVAVFRNHAKIYAGIGSKFAFAIESSANINTNPRTENTAIHVGQDIFAFYLDFFNQVQSFQRDYDGWTPWKKE